MGRLRKEPKARDVLVTGCIEERIRKLDTEVELLEGERARAQKRVDNYTIQIDQLNYVRKTLREVTKELQGEFQADS